MISQCASKLQAFSCERWQAAPAKDQASAPSKAAVNGEPSEPFFSPFPAPSDTVHPFARCATHHLFSQMSSSSILHCITSRKLWWWCSSSSRRSESLKR